MYPSSLIPSSLPPSLPPSFHPSICPFPLQEAVEPGTARCYVLCDPAWASQQCNLITSGASGSQYLETPASLGADFKHGGKDWCADRRSCPPPLLCGTRTDVKAETALESAGSSATGPACQAAFSGGPGWQQAGHLCRLQPLNRLQVFEVETGQKPPADTGRFGGFLVPWFTQKFISKVIAHQWRSWHVETRPW